jgi:DNA polymerase I-like protein with 3'-5' exonuclease and polymerase domains
MFVPDPGFVLIEPDLSGAEARVVAILAKDEKLLKIFKYELDLHRITTGWIEGTCPEDLLEEFFNETSEIKIYDLRSKITTILKNTINDEQRQVGKKFRHAGHYDMGKREASRQTGFSEWKTKQLLDKFHATNPNIRNVFHKEIIEALRDNNRILVSPHGRRRQFLNRWGDELFKEAYADIPQATVSDHLKFSARMIEKRAPWIQILSESHDSFLAQVPNNQVDNMIRISREELDKPIDFKNCSLSRGELVIPSEFTLFRNNWEVGEKIR